MAQVLEKEKILRRTELAGLKKKKMIKQEYSTETERNEEIAPCRIVITQNKNKAKLN